ncbi:MAG: hypothetical protein RI907_1214, partial [Pseudomonadota bacterium]
MTTHTLLQKRLWALNVGLVWAAVAAPLGAQGLPDIRRADAQVRRVDTTDRVLVRYKDADAARAPDEAHLRHARAAGTQSGLTLSHHRRMGNGTDVFQISRKLGTRDMRALMDEMKRQDAAIDSIEPDVRVYAMATRAADPDQWRQWALWDYAGIWAINAWNYSRGTSSVVAVLDSGVLPHPDLQANLLPGYDFIGNLVNTQDGDGRDADASDPGDWAEAGRCDASAGASSSSWHGTHVAGIIAAAGYNGLGVTGI